MEQNITAQDLRELLSLAKRLRDFAAATVDLHYIELFLCTADALEKRASQLALGGADMHCDQERHAVSHAPVSMMC